MREKIFSSYLIGFDEDHFDVKVMYQDIFFIETIPYTHYCNVFYTHGRCRLYYDSVRLLRHLGDTFLKVSASAIINVDKIIRVDKKSHFLYVTDVLYCVYTSKYWKKLKLLLLLHSYRNVKLFPKEQKEFIFVYAEDYVLQKIKKSHIVLIESIAECHRCRVVSQIGVYEIRGDLSVLETQMPDNFVRCRRNCLINLDYVEYIDRSNRIVQLQSKYYSYDAVREDDILNY